MIKKNGPMITYFENGDISVSGFFKDDARDKKWTFYDETTHKITAIENYVSNVLEGEQFYYYPDGTLKLKGSYKNNQRIGFWEQYTPDGKLEVQNIFLEGKDTINVAIYQSNGKILCSGAAKNDLREGIWQYFDTDGILLYDVTYEKGIRNGEWRAYDKNGKILVTGYYIDGKIIGLE